MYYSFMRLPRRTHRFTTGMSYIHDGDPPRLPLRLQSQRETEPETAGCRVFVTITKSSKALLRNSNIGRNGKSVALIDWSDRSTLPEPARQPVAVE